MKQVKWILILLICNLILPLSAQIRGNEIRVVVSPDKLDWTYKPGEKCNFTVQVYKAQNLLPDAVIDYEIGPDRYPAEKKQNVVLKDGKLTLSGKMTEPGFYRCNVTAKVNGVNYQGTAAAAYAPEQIKPRVTEPAGFYSYWTDVLADARQIPLATTMTLLPERCTEKVNVYEVSYQNIRHGSRTFGILCVPKAPGKYPALLRVPGAGVRPYYGDVMTAEKGAITLEIGIHGVSVTQPQAFYDLLSNGAVNGYPFQNTDDKDGMYYKRVVVGAVRGVDLIASLPEFNGEALGVTGSSQGGALSVITAALDNRVTCYAAVHPAMCDHQAARFQVAGGWPHYFEYNTNPSQAQIATADYYDVVNFGRHIQVPGWFSWGYNDQVCPPTSMYAAYNTISAPKTLDLYLETAHFWYQEQYDAWNNWLWNQMGL